MANDQTVADLWDADHVGDVGDSLSLLAKAKAFEYGTSEDDARVAVAHAAIESAVYTLAELHGVPLDPDTWNLFAETNIALRERLAEYGARAVSPGNAG